AGPARARARPAAGRPRGVLLLAAHRRSARGRAPAALSTEPFARGGCPARAQPPRAASPPGTRQPGRAPPGRKPPAPPTPALRRAAPGRRALAFRAASGGRFASRSCDTARPGDTDRPRAGGTGDSSGRPEERGSEGRAEGEARSLPLAAPEGRAQAGPARD